MGLKNELENKIKYIRDCLLSEYPYYITNKVKVVRDYYKLGYSISHIKAAIDSHTEIIKNTDF